MKRKFEPCVLVMSRFGDLPSRIGESPELPDYESTESGQRTPALKRARCDQVTAHNLHLIDKKLADHGKSVLLNQSAASELEAATYSTAYGKMTPQPTTEVLTEAATPNPCQPLTNVLAALSKPEQQVFAASQPTAPLTEGETRAAEEKPSAEKETNAYLLTKVSELQGLLAEARIVNSHQARDFGMFTKIELRHLMTSHGPAREIIDELVARGVSEKALERCRGLGNEDMYKLFCEHPDVGEQFEKCCKEALVDYKLLCKDSYMQALREVERDNKSWLGFQKGFSRNAVGGVVGVDAEALHEKIGLSPAARALQSPMIWASPDIPRDPARARESVRDAAEGAKASLESVKRRKLTNVMDKESIHKRVMRPMGDKY